MDMTDKLFIAVTVLVLGGVLSFGAFRCAANLSGENEIEAEKNAIAWARDVGIENAHINCVTIDSDGDGYVSCTVSYKDNTGAVQTKAIECTGRFNINTGCRSPKFSVKTQ